MLDRFVRQAYLRLGGRYDVVYLLAQGSAALTIATLTVLLLTSYYDASARDLLVTLAVTWASTIAAVVFALWRGRPYLERALAWQSTPAPSAEESIAAWDVATNYPVRSFRANVVSVGTIAAAPAVASITVVLGLGPVDVLVLLVASPAAGGLRDGPQLLHRRAADAPARRGHRGRAARGLPLRDQRPADPQAPEDPAADLHRLRRARRRRAHDRRRRHRDAGPQRRGRRSASASCSRGSSPCCCRARSPRRSPRCASASGACARATTTRACRS